MVGGFNIKCGCGARVAAVMIFGEILAGFWCGGCGAAYNEQGEALIPAMAGV